MAKIIVDIPIEFISMIRRLVKDYENDVIVASSLLKSTTAAGREQIPKAIDEKVINPSFVDRQASPRKRAVTENKESIVGHGVSLKQAVEALKECAKPPTTLTNKALLRQDIGVQLIKKDIATGTVETIILTGGAVIDILESKTPKDYDVVVSNILGIQAKLIEAGWVYVHDSKTAITYTKKGIVLQLLKTKISDFKYTIEQGQYNLSKNALKMDENAFDNKLLIPAGEYTYARAVGCLQRLPHWSSKGYEIADVTYLSLLGVVSNKRYLKES